MRRRRDSKGRFISNRRRSTSRRRRTTRRRARVAVAVANPRRRVTRRRRRTYRRNVYMANPRRRTRRRSYRRNPALFRGKRILGMSMTEIAYTGVGFIAPPAIEGFVSQWIPTQITATPLGRYAVKTGIVAGVSMIGGKFVSREAGKYLAIGGVVYLLATAMIEYTPQLFSGFSGYMSPGRTLGMRAQPGLGTGRYIRNLPVSHASGGTSADRLDPRARF